MFFLRLIRHRFRRCSPTSRLLQVLFFLELVVGVSNRGSSANSLLPFFSRHRLLGSPKAFAQMVKELAVVGSSSEQQNQNRDADGLDIFLFRDVWDEVVEKVVILHDQSSSDDKNNKSLNKNLVFTNSLNMNNSSSSNYTKSKKTPPPRLKKTQLCLQAHSDQTFTGNPPDFFPTSATDSEEEEDQPRNVVFAMDLKRPPPDFLVNNNKKSQSVSSETQTNNIKDSGHAHGGDGDDDDDDLFIREEEKSNLDLFSDQWRPFSVTPVDLNADGHTDVVVTWELVLNSSNSTSFSNTVFSSSSSNTNTNTNNVNNKYFYSFVYLNARVAWGSRGLDLAQYLVQTSDAIVSEIPPFFLDVNRDGIPDLFTLERDAAGEKQNYIRYGTLIIIV